MWKNLKQVFMRCRELIFYWSRRSPHLIFVGILLLSGGIFGSAYILLLHGSWIVVVVPLLTLASIILITSSYILWEELQYSHKKLEEYSRTLEQKVLERTENLELEINERERIKSTLDSQNHILELIALGIPLHEVLRELVLFIESQADQAICSFLLFEPDTNRLRLATAPSIPDEYNKAIDFVDVGLYAGSCGTAAYLKQPVIVTDIATDPLWLKFRNLALKHNLRACWSKPVLSLEDDLLGTFAMYYREPRSPSQRDQDLLYDAVYLARIAIERDRTEVHLKKTKEDAEAANKAKSQFFGKHES